MDYKKTLLMPLTDFEMHANLKQNEKAFRSNWIKNNIYNKTLEKNKGNKSFILHDGPPYANGGLHVGHALNKILKDIVIRRKNMEGFYAPYLVGWDTHGLPIENKMLENMKMSKDDIDKISLRKEAYNYVLKQVKKQKLQFQKMQLFAPLEKKYLTFDKNFEVGQLQLFKKMVLDGLIYKGLKPIFWSPSSQSALAEAEVEYKNYVSPQIIVALEVSNHTKFLNQGDNLLIMTTTPWTLIANSGVAVDANFDYAIIEYDNNRYVIAKKLINDIVTNVKWKNFKILQIIKGQDLVGVKYICPIKKELQAPVVIGHHITDDTGTGLVHMAPLFGEDDYIVAKKERLNMIMHVDDKGYLNKEAGIYEGKFYQDVNKDIGLKLDAEKKLLSLKFFKHSYPHDWRTDQPVIFRGVPQWFVNIKTIKNKILKELRYVKSFPDWGIKKLAKMISERDEWTISRQRSWGVPIIIFYDQNHKPIIKEELFDYVIALVVKNGTDIWWEKETDELLPESYRGKGITREMDIMDVWFDSGSSSISVQVNGIKAPFDLYFEGSDQYRGWFNSSLIIAIAYYGKPPFKTLVSHGFVLDEKKEKMSKSRGNVIDPLQIINDKGADILRLWVANSEYKTDVSISNKIIKQTEQLYWKIRNTIRFMLGNLSDFNYVKNKLPLEKIHYYISNKIKKYHNNINVYYDSYNFNDVVKTTNKFLIDLSSWYFNYAKDILYCNKKNDPERRQIQTNMFEALLVFLKSLAPIIPTTAEEAYQKIPNYNHQESIFLERINKKNMKINFDHRWVDFEKNIRPKINNLIEKEIKKNQAKRSNELVLYITNSKDLNKIATNEELAKYLLVAKVKLGRKYKIKKPDLVKCMRCWNYFYHNQIKKNICFHCFQVLCL